MDTSDTLTPPAGFQLDTPQPPDGFQLDAPSNALPIPPAGFQMDPPPQTSAWKQFFPAMFDLSPEQQDQQTTVKNAWAQAKAQGITPQQMAQHAQDISTKWDAIIAQTRESRPENVPMMEAQRDSEMRGAGVEPLYLNEPVQLPKLTDSDVHTLYPSMGPRAVNAIKTGQNMVANTGESFATPSGVAMFAPGIGPAIGKAFVGQMAASLPQKLMDAGGAYAGGDTQAGDAALIEAGSTAAMLGVPLLAGHKAAGKQEFAPEIPKEDWLPKAPAEAPDTTPAAGPIPHPPEGFVTDAVQTTVPVPTSPASVAAQGAAAMDPAHPRAAVLQVPGEVAPPPTGLVPVATAQGTAWINPAKIDARGAQQQFNQPNGGGTLLGMASETKPADATTVVTTRDAQGTPVTDEAASVTTLPDALAAARAARPPGGSVEVRTPEAVIAERNQSAREPSAIALKTMEDLTADRQPVPASLMPLTGIAPEALAKGYHLNDAGDAYEFTAPEAKLTPEQQMARDNVQTMAELRGQKGETPNAEQPTPNTEGTETPAPERPAALVPVEVKPADVKAAASKMERALDILDTIADHYSDGVKFDRADQGEVVKTSRGAAAELMSHTSGEPADQVLKGLHEAGLFPRLETADDLAGAMKDAGDQRIAQRADGGDALALAQAQKRTQLFEQVANKARAGQSEPLPVNQLFPGDTFKLKGQPVKVEEQVMDADTGKPSHVRVSGAFGDQHLPADGTVHLDKGSLKNPGLIKGSKAEAWADQVIVQSSKRLNAGVDPELLTAYAVKGAAFVESGLRDFAKWSVAMVREFGEAIKPHLQNLFTQAREISDPPIKVTGEEFGRGLSDADLRAAARTEAVKQFKGTTVKNAETGVGITIPASGIDHVKGVSGDIRKVKLLAALPQILERSRFVGSKPDFKGNPNVKQWHYFETHALVGKDLVRVDSVVREDHQGHLFYDYGLSDIKKELPISISRDSSEPKTDGPITGNSQEQSTPATESVKPGTRQFAEQLQDSQDISDALKGTVINTLYERRPQEDDASYAQRIMQDAGGPDQARTIFNQETRLPQPVRMALGMQILKTLDAAGRHADAADFFDRDFAPHTTDVAQGLAMLNAWHSMSKEGKLFWAQKKIHDAANDAVAPVKPDLDAAKVELQKQNASGIERTTADPQVQAGAKTAVTDAVAHSPETHAGIVMELTQPWASAKVILDMARAQVHAKANDLLTKQPRPIGFTAAQHLRAIMDDLAKRAADIAAGHYRGAEPGVPLKTKLVQRLGISEDAAGRLANALDKEFSRQVRAAEAALPRRLAAIVARQAKGLPVDATETAVDRSIRRQLTANKQTLGTVVRDHFTKVDATKTDLTAKLVKQAGLTGDAATKLAELINRRFDALTSFAKQAALNQLLKPVKKLGLAKPQMVDRLVKLSNLGAFDDAKFYNTLRERMNLPTWTPELRNQLNALADRIGRIPADRMEEIQRVQTDFQNAIERAKGISNLELGLAFYMGNILSGLTTHVRVGIHTSAQIMAATSAEVGQAMTQGRLSDIPLIFEALGRGAGKALTQQKDIFRSGLVVGSKLQKVVPLSVLEQIHFGEKGGTTFRQGPIAKAILENKLATILNAWKYNQRLITAQHMLYYAPAEEIKLALLASRQARTEGLQGRAAVDRARQILGYGAAQVRAAEAQAMREGLEGPRAKMRTAEILKAGIDPAMRQTARDYALHQTFLNDPYGFAGAMANVVADAKHSSNAKLATAARVIVPFTRIAANLFNEGLNYTPIGAARARFAKTELLGQKFADMTLEQRSDLQRELYAKSALGTMLLTAVAFKAAQGLNQANPDFTLYGAGPNNPQDKAAWRAAGGIPYSVKIGGRYVSYANTPGNVMFAALGNYLDGARDAALYKRPGAERLAEDMPMRAAAATRGAGKVVLEQPFLQSLLEIAKTAGENNPEVGARGAIKMVARTASSFAVPNILRQVDRFYDPTSYDQKTLGGILTAQVPFVRQTGRPVLNALGQPVQSPVFGMMTSPATQDPLVQMLTEHNFWPSVPNRNQTTVNGVPLSDDEFYTYTKARGQALANYLASPNVGPMLDKVATARDDLQQRAATSVNPVAQAKLTHVATGLQNGIMLKFEAAANKSAEAAVVRMRGY